MKCVYLALLFLLCSSSALGDLTIDLTYYTNGTENDTVTFKEFQDSAPFRLQYANIQSGTTGLIHQPDSRNGCSYIQPLPFSLTENHTIFALIDDYPSCVPDMITNVRNAGYGLIIASGQKRTVTKEVQNSGFSVAIVDQDYANYLKNQTLIDVTDFDDKEYVKAQINANLNTTIALMSSLMSAVLMCCCACCICCCLCCRCCSRERDIDRQIREIEERRQNFEQVQRRDRYARQELIESILRQLAELQVDMRRQVPLGEQATKQLPTRPYKPGNEINDNCAICVDDFSEGDSLRILPCNHAFHTKCVDEWLINHSALCPLCKMEVHYDKNLGRDGRPIRIQNVTTDDSSAVESDEDQESLLLPSNRNEQRGGTSHYGSF